MFERALNMPVHFKGIFKKKNNKEWKQIPAIKSK